MNKVKVFRHWSIELLGEEINEWAESNGVNLISIQMASIKGKLYDVLVLYNTREEV